MGFEPAFLAAAPRPTRMSIAIGAKIPERPTLGKRARPD
jgi:hypothetical protein